MKVYWLLFGVISLSLIIFPSKAFAQEISLICNDSDGNYALGSASIKLGNLIDCFAYASDIVAREDGHVLVIAPTGNTIIDMAVDKSKVTPFSFVADQVGSYIIDLSYIDISGVEFDIHANVNVSAFVIPESPMGSVALVGLSLAALGGFIILRKRQLQNKL